MSEARSSDLAGRVWVKMSALVLDNERRHQVSRTLGMSIGRVQALRRIAAASLPMGELAELLGIDPPYMTLVVDDLEARGFVQRRDHPADRRAKLVVATEMGLGVAREADRILDEPPRSLLTLSQRELLMIESALIKVVGGVSEDRHESTDTPGQDSTAS